MSQINRIPIGYLDLLGTETGGRNPSEGVEAVSPILVMNELYLAQTLNNKNFATNSTAVGNNNFFEVPADETWLLYSISADVIQPLVGDFDQVTIALRSLPRSGPSASGTATIAALNMETKAAGSQPRDAVFLPNPFVLSHGVEVIAEISDRAGGAANRVVNISMLVGELKG